MSDGSKLPVVALVDSRYSGSSIDESFAQENKITTYNLSPFLYTMWMVLLTVTD
jgi:hypothetical protein